MAVREAPDGHKEAVYEDAQQDPQDYWAQAYVMPHDRRPEEWAVPSEQPGDGSIAQEQASPQPESDRDDSPLELEAPDWRDAIKRTLKEIKDDRMPLVAAGMAFYFFLAIFPALIATVGVLGLLNVSEDFTAQINDSIRSSLPGGAGQVLTDAVADAQNRSQAASLTAALAGVAVALWSASSGVVALQAGLNVAYDIPQDRKFVKKRLVAFGLLVAMALLGGVPSPLFTFGDALVFQILGWALTVAAVVLLFSVFYYVGPNRDSPQWHWVTPGGLIGPLIWIVVALAFGFYVDNFSSYAKTYAGRLRVSSC